MSLLFRSSSVTAADLIPRRDERASSSRPIHAEEAMRSSAVWACLRLRADLISTSPVDCYRRVGQRSVGVPTPPVLVTPGGAKVDITEWLYSTQVDLDRFGNCFGLITARDGLGFPSRIDLLPGETMTVKTTDGAITEFRSGSKSFAPDQIWHEKQYTVAGLPVGLSPLAAAAMSLRSYLSAQEFAVDWFSGGAVPSSHLKNTAKTLNANEATTVKDRFNASVRTGDVFVTGSDWEYEMLGASASESSFIESMRFGVPDVCRFLGVPADLIDGGETGGSITYANVTQRNLQLLIMNLGPAVTRREKALSGLLPSPRFMKLNTDAVVLRMDAKSRAEMNALLLSSKQRTPSEVREKDDLPPFTPAQVSEIHALNAPPQPAQVTKSSDIYVTTPPVTVTTPPVNVDARTTLEPPSVNVTMPTIEIPPAPDIHVDARTTVTPPEVHVTSPEVTVAAPVVNVEAPPARSRTIERDKEGNISRIVEES